MTYTFSTFQELVNRVPVDRVYDCMAELGSWLVQAKETAMFGTGEDCEIILPKSFTWIDDGKGILRTTCVDAKGSRLTVESKLEATP